MHCPPRRRGGKGKITRTQIRTTKSFRKAWSPPFANKEQGVIQHEAEMEIRKIKFPKETAGTS
jgi:hypothetical protein